MSAVCVSQSRRWNDLAAENRSDLTRRDHEVAARAKAPELYKTAQRWKMMPPILFTNSALCALSLPIAAIANALASSRETSTSSLLVSLLP